MAAKWSLDTCIRPSECVCARMCMCDWIESLDKKQMRMSEHILNIESHLETPESYRTWIFFDVDTVPFGSLPKAIKMEKWAREATEK